jgi:solute:Na+ symporter, SSS family
MLDPLIFLIILTTFASISVGIGLYASYSITSTSEYFFAGKRLGVLPITLTLLASQIGGGFFTGIAQESYQTGLYGMLYALGISTGFIILGTGLAARIKNLQITTTSELFESHYGSTLLKKIASSLSILSLWGITIGQIVALDTILTGVGITDPMVSILFWITVMLYTALGGFKAALYVDIFKESFIILLFSIIFIYSISAGSGIVNTVENLFLNHNLFTIHGDFFDLFPIFLMPALFCLIEQDIAQSFFAARDKKTATVSALIAGLFLTLFAIVPTFFGMQTKILGLPVIGSSNPIVILCNALLHPVVFAGAITGLILAISTTAHSLLCAISAHINHDFDLRWMGSWKKIRIAQVITALAGTSALVSGKLINQSILGILTESYALSVSCLLIPSLGAYFGIRANKCAAGSAMVFGLVSFFLGKLYPWIVGKTVITLVVSLLGFLLGSVHFFITPRRKKL